MNKLLVIAAGVATVCADYTYTYAPFVDSGMENDYFNFEFDFATDAYYTTTYGADANSEDYGFEVNTYMVFSFAFEFFSFYMHVIDVTVTPFKIVPYNQAVTYSRLLDTSETFTADTTGSSEITILDIATSHSENAKVCGASFVNAAMGEDTDLMPECDYSDEFESTYDDDFWSFNTGDYLYADQSWEGYYEYFTATLF